MRNLIRVLGIDQSLTCTGWCIVDFVKKKSIKVKKYGIIEPKKLRDVERLVFIKDILKGVIQKYKPTDACMEGYAFERRNVMAPYQIGELGGVIKVLLKINRITVESINPMTLKKQVAGYGRASKDQMIETAKELSGIKFGQVRETKRDNSTDAFCLCYGFALNHGYIE